MTNTDEDPDPPADIALTDPLGRRSYSSRQWKHATRAKNPFVEYQIFVDRARPALSHDRLGHASDTRMTKLAVAGIPPERTQFYGWAVINPEQAHANSCRVVPAATPENKYHADVHFADEVREDHEARVQVAKALSTVAEWRNRA